MADTDKTSMAALIRKSPANYEYFFNKLGDPAWLEALVDTGFFRSPPGPERGDEWMRYPNWPESRYLARIAAQAPAEVLEIAKAIPSTDNPRVHQDILEVATQLPGTMAAQLVRKENKWLRAYTGNLVSLPSVVGPLIAHLGREGQIKAALELASTLLAVAGTDEPLGGRKATAARLAEYEYAEVIRSTWPALMEADPGRALSFLRNRLRDAASAAEPGLTTFWRPAIEDHAQNVGHGVLDPLVDALRDFALAALQEPDGWELVLSVLDDSSDPIFQRLVLYLLRMKGSTEAVASALSDNELAHEVDYWHEYGELLRARFPELSTEQKERVLVTLARGPELEMTPWREERGDTADDLRKAERYYQFQRYTLIAGHLDGERRQLYESLREEYGEPEHPTFLSYTSSWTGPTSPYTEADLLAMDPPQVIEALREWSPEPGPQNASPEGLGRILESVIAAKPTDFAAMSSEFVGLDATYVRAFLAGLTQAAKSERPFDWEPVIALCGWVLTQTGDQESHINMSRDPHWGWARKQVASLLSQGFAQGPAEAPRSQREAIWNLLAALAEDSDPTPEQEQRPDGEGMDPATLSINTTRGEAIHAVIRYVLWVERALDETAETTGIEFAPEAKDLLERHLDPAVDPSLAIRSIYGQWFPQFVRLDKDWSRQLVPLVFPTTLELSAHFDAAWNTYVRFNRPYTDVFKVLRDAYARAVQKISEQDTESARGRESPSERLGDHLLSYRVLRETADEAEGLFATYWDAASSDLRKQVITGAGWSLERSPSLDPSTGARFVATWEWIFEKTRTSDPAALAGFGAWLGATTLDGDWLLKQARAVLELDVHLDPDFVVYKALPRLASEHAREAVEVLRRMVLTDTEGWSLHGATDETHEALRLVLTTDDADTRNAAEELVHLLGARGMTEFRDLVSG